VVSQSSAKSKYPTMENVTCELVWVKDLLTEIGFAPEYPIKLYCDNQAVINITENSVFHERTKHIEVDCHLVRQKIEDCSSSTCFIRSSVD